MPADTRALGAPPELLWLPVAQLHVDPAYQRTIESRRSQAAVERMVEEFTWLRFQVPTITLRRAQDGTPHLEGGYLIIDGQHRVEAARRLGLAEVPCYLVEAATRELQADGFVRINRDRVTVNPYALHRAQLVAGDPAARTIDDVCRRAGVEIPTYPIPATKLAPRQTLALGTIGKAIAAHAAGAAIRALKLLREAYPDRAGNLRAPHIAALAGWMAIMGGERTDLPRLARAIGRQAALSRELDARQRAAERGIKTTDALLELLRAAYDREPRIEPLARPGQVPDDAAPGARAIGRGDGSAGGAADYSKPRPDARDQTKKRKCLRCGKTFTSHHFGERVCGDCKSTAAWRSGIEA